MSDLNPQKVKVNIDGQEYKLHFSVRAIDEIQDKFDAPITLLGEFLSDERTRYDKLCTVISVLANAAYEDENSAERVDDESLKTKIRACDFAGLRDSVYICFANGTPLKDEAEDEEADPNPASEQPKCSRLLARFLSAKRSSATRSAKPGT